MSESPRAPRLNPLPDELPIFPLSGALLLPGGRLPLNIFEPRYLNMVRDALARGRVLGMIQPIDLPDEAETPRDDATPSTRSAAPAASSASRRPTTAAC